jgi:hypothetical protein
MTLTGGSQATTVLARFQNCVSGMWIFFAYKGHPRELSLHNLDVLNKRLVSFLEEFDNNSELTTTLPSSEAIQAALKKTIDSLGGARDTFAYSSPVIQRKHFYLSYKHIFTCVSQLKELLEATSAPAAEPLPLASTLQLQAGSELARLHERITSIWKLFHYEYRNLSDLPLPRLLDLEAELRQILEEIATTREIRDALCSADKLQDGLRNAVLQLNFAADMLKLPPDPDRSRQLRKIHSKLDEYLERSASQKRRESD